MNHIFRNRGRVYFALRMARQKKFEDAEFDTPEGAANAAIALKRRFKLTTFVEIYKIIEADPECQPGADPVQILIAKIWGT